jgi:hypothetical protein
VRQALAVSSLLAVLGAGATAPGAAAAPRVTATPNPIPFGETLRVKGRGWPVFESCERAVRLSLRSDQNAVRLGAARVGTRGRFRFTWVPRRREVGRGDWTVVARMRCESGRDGSPNPVVERAPIRIGPANLVVGRGRTSRARWELYTRRGRFGGFCVGLALRALGEDNGPSGEGCGGGFRGRPLTLGLTYARGLGTFAYGRVRLDVGRVEVTFGNSAPLEARILPRPRVPGFRTRFWIAPFEGQCADVSVRAFDGEGNPLGQIGIPPAPPPDPGEPSPRPDEDCPKAP